jgi:hypothetical protein
LGRSFLRTPTVRVVDGFIFRILLPPREHGPPHVHVTRSGGVAVILLPTARRRVGIREVAGMRRADVVRAARPVEAHADTLLKAWRQHHDDADH